MHAQTTSIDSKWNFLMRPFRMKFMRCDSRAIFADRRTVAISRSAFAPRGVAMLSNLSG
jgi:hypothetical protein